MKTLKRITNTEDVNTVKTVAAEYATAYRTDDWHKEDLLTRLQNVLKDMKSKYSLTDAEWATLYTRFVLSI